MRVILSLTAEITKGADITDVCKRMCELCKQSGENVNFTFNGVPLMVNPMTKPDYLEEVYKGNAYKRNQQ
jgi:hypothetical protein